MKVAALDDLKVPAAGFGDGAGRDRDALAGVERGRGWSRAAGYLVSEASTITGAASKEAAPLQFRLAPPTTMPTHKSAAKPR